MITNIQCGTEPQTYQNFGSDNGAAGVYVEGGVVRNCLLAGNVLGKTRSSSSRCYGTGAYVAGGEFVNNTVIQNVLNGDSNTTAMVYHYTAVYAAGGKIVNSLIADNALLTDASIQTNGWDVGLYYNCFANSAADLPGGDNVEATGKTLYSFDFGGLPSLVRNSPCIARGRNEDWMATALDLAGNPRLHGGRVDVGAVESLWTPGFLMMIR